MTAKRFRFIFLLILLGISLFLLRTVSSQRLHLVSEVIDGDTIRLENGTVVRYLNIDAPEEDECYASQAQKINQELVEGQKVRIETDVNEMDRFGRILAYVYVQDQEKGEIFVNEHLLQKGAAIFQLDTVNIRYQSSLITEAEKARQEKEGLWRYCAPDPLKGCLVKGSYDKRGHRWYHLPEFRHYEQVVVNLENGDQWFCTEKEAREAGFRRARE